MAIRTHRVSLATPKSLILIPLLSAGLLNMAHANTFTQGSDGVLTVEAESAATTALGNSKWAVASQSGTSAGKYLRKQGGGFYGSSGAGPSANVTFKASRGGSHDVWLRAYAPDDGSDSLHIDLDGSASTYHFSRGNLARWVWVKVRTVSLGSGRQHTLKFWAREDNLRIDKVVVQPAGRGAPSTWTAQSGSTGNSSSGTGGSSGSSSSGSTGSTHTQGSDGVLSIEAESAATTAIGNSKWAVASQSGTSGGKYLKKQGGGWYSSSGTGPSAKFPFKAVRSGNHDIWLKAYAPDGGSDSLHLDLDGSVSTYHFSSNNLARWVWVKVRTVKLNAGGQNMLTLWAREDNLRIDKVVIQPAGRGTPSDSGTSGGSTSSTNSGTSGSTGGSSSGSTGNFFWAGREFGVEAESVVTTAVGNSKWAVASQSGTSGGKYLRKQGGGWYRSSGAGPSAKIPFKAHFPGTYDVWLRAFAPDGGSDSLHIDFDGSVSTYHFSSNNHARWVWVKVRTIVANPNYLHNLSLWAREDNLRIDKIAFRPAGSGAPHTNWLNKKRSFAEAFSASADELSRRADLKVVHRKPRDLYGLTGGIDVSAFGLHGEVQVSVVADPEYGDIGISFSFERGVQVPGGPELGGFGNVVLGDNGLRMDTYVDGNSIVANGNISIPGRVAGIEVVRATPTTLQDVQDFWNGSPGILDNPGVTEYGIRVGTVNPSLPANVGMSVSSATGWSVNIPEIVDAVIDSLDVSIDVAIEAYTDTINGPAPGSTTPPGPSPGSSGGGSDGNGGDPSAAGPGSGYGDGYSGHHGSGTWGRSGYKPLLQPSNGVLSVEAESALTNALGSSKWAVISQSGASAGRALRKQGGSFYSYSGGGPGARLEFNASRSGNHDVWLRAYAPDDGSDSLHIDLDGSASTYHFSRGNLARWVWVKVRTVRLSAGGQHALTLWAREDNLRIDKVVIQPAGRGAPS